MSRFEARARDAEDWQSCLDPECPGCLLFESPDTPGWLNRVRATLMRPFNRRLP